jgi:uncharacterized membrane protein YcaP (DUF421 family)
MWGVFLTIFNKRFIQISTPFDVILRVAIGSLASTAIIGGMNFLSALAIISFLVILNLVFAALSFYSNTLENILFGNSYILYKEGDIKWKEMKRNFITKKHLLATIAKKWKLK